MVPAVGGNHLSQSISGAHFQTNYFSWPTFFLVGQSVFGIVELLDGLDRTQFLMTASTPTHPLVGVTVPSTRRFIPTSIFQGGPSLFAQEF